MAGVNNEQASMHRKSIQTPGVPEAQAAARLTGGTTIAAAASGAEAAAQGEERMAWPSAGSPRQRAVVLAPAFPPTVGGIEQLVYRLCRHAKRLQPEVITPWVPGAKAFDARQPFPIRRTRPCLPHGIPGRLALSVCGAYLIRASRNEVSFALCAHIAAGLPALLAKRIFGVPYVLYCHGSELYAPTSRRAALYRGLLGQAACVIANSRYTRGLLEQLYGLPAERVAVVPPSVDTREFHPEVDGAAVRARHGLERARVALTVGRISMVEGHKAQDRVIQALPEVVRHVPTAHYVIVGTGDDEPRLNRLAERLGVAERVTFAGAVSQRELPEYYAAADLYVMPSRHLPRGHTAAFEGFGMVFAEAAATGLPVIGGRTGGVEDAVVHGETGLLIDPEKEDQLTDSLITLLRDRLLATRLGNQGRERAVREYSCEAVVSRFEAVVMAALSRPASAGPAN